MFRIDDPSAAPSLPTPEAAGTPGYWTEGNPGSGVPATLVRASFLNMLQEELMSVLTAAGITPNKTTYNQLLAAIQSIGQGYAIGFSQTWQNLTGSRANNTTYTNSTSKTIVVSAFYTGVLSAAHNVQGTVAGVQPFYQYIGAASTYQHVICCVLVVPPGATYNINGAGTLTQWAELR